MFVLKCKLYCGQYTVRNYLLLLRITSGSGCVQDTHRCRHRIGERLENAVR
jgi:hypothetical protein